MKHLPVLLALVAGGAAVYLYQRKTAPRPTTSNGWNDVFGGVLGAVRSGAGILSGFWGSGGSESGNPGGATNRTATSFDTAFVDLDDTAPTTMTVSPGLYTTA